MVRMENYRVQNPLSVESHREVFSDQRVVSTENIDTFKSRLDETWKQSGNKFTIDEPTQTEDHERSEEAF